MGTWNPHLATGIPELELWHQELFRRAQVIHDAAARGGARPAISEMLRFLEQRFHAEQRIMASANYPALKEHSAQHASFMRTLAVIASEIVLGGHSDAVGLHLNEVVRDWLVRHVASDTDAVRFVARLPSASPGSPHKPPPVAR